MAQFKKPIFTPEEIVEIESGGLHIGYDNGTLIPGYDFGRKPFNSKVAAAFVNAKEKLDGTAKKRLCHAMINSFGWARFDKDKLIFGIKFSSPRGLSKIGEKVVKKYEQWVGYFLEQSGWINIQVEKDENMAQSYYVVPLDNPQNIKLLYTLSPSIGFYYKAKRPEMDDLDRLEMMCSAKSQTAKKNKSKTR